MPVYTAQEHPELLRCVKLDGKEIPLWTVFEVNTDRGTIKRFLLNESGKRFYAWKDKDGVWYPLSGLTRTPTYPPPDAVEEGAAWEEISGKVEVEFNNE